MGAAKTDDLFPEVHNPEGTQIVNERCMIKAQEGRRVVLVSGIVLASYAVTDRMAEAYAMVSLIEQGWASQHQVANALGRSTRTVRRDQRRFENGGLAALGHGGGYPRIPRSRFAVHTARCEGRKVSYVLADQEVRLLKGKLRLRQVTRRMENGHQTPILTSRRDLSAIHVAYRMFDRWRQENFFKYLREEYALDALAEYAAVPDDANREVPNPAWAALDAQLRQAWARVDRLQSEYGLEALNNLERKHCTMRGFKIAYGKLGQTIWSAWQRVLQLEKRRAAVPRRVPVREAIDKPIGKLAPERKHLTNLIKMVAYQAESMASRGGLMREETLL